jgi:hypothetical protein
LDEKPKFHFDIEPPSYDFLSSVVMKVNPDYVWNCDSLDPVFWFFFDNENSKYYKTEEDGWMVGARYTKDKKRVLVFCTLMTLKDDTIPMILAKHLVDIKNCDFYSKFFWEERSFYAMQTISTNLLTPEILIDLIIKVYTECDLVFPQIINLVPPEQRVIPNDLIQAENKRTIQKAREYLMRQQNYDNLPEEVPDEDQSRI